MKNIKHDYTCRILLKNQVDIPINAVNHGGIGDPIDDNEVGVCMNDYKHELDCKLLFKNEVQINAPELKPELTPEQLKKILENASKKFDEEKKANQTKALRDIEDANKIIENASKLRDHENLCNKLLVDRYNICENKSSKFP